MISEMLQRSTAVATHTIMSFNDRWVFGADDTLQ